MAGEDPKVNDNEAETSQDKADREAFIEFLTSTGRIKKALAESLYEQGLDSYEKLET
ncbi:MAG: hypothetical protein ACMUIG_09770 [Thermoplasmatota archaeon]